MATIETKPRVVFQALVGSTNYNLDTETSDRDYKVFVLPSFDDLYEGRMIGKEITGETADYNVHDIRKLPKLLWKANVNFIEVLYSVHLELPQKEPFASLMQGILDQKDALARMNLPYLYQACRGMAVRKHKEMLLDSPKKHERFQKHGYDPKCLYHAVRLFDFLVRMDETMDFGEAIWYRDKEKARNLLLAIKQGKYTLEDGEQLYQQYEEQSRAAERWAEVFSADPERLEWLKNQIKAMVASGLILA